MPQWVEIKNKQPFISALNQVQKNTRQETQNNQTASLTTLSTSVSRYRQFINDLEALEDKKREQRDQARQQGLADAQDELRNLQKEQGKISELLDQALTQKREDLEQKWPIARFKEKSNVSETKKLEQKMKMLAPEAAYRIAYAAESMDQTLTHGDSQDYVQAESAADLAGRLLRQALKESQGQGQNSKPRKRRHVSGDNYYGQSVFGGDIEIKSDYRVDHRYREDVLDGAKEESYDKDEQILLDRYLREVIR